MLLRFFGRKGTYLSTAESNELLDIYHLRKFRFMDWTMSAYCVLTTTPSIRTWMNWRRTIQFDRLKPLKVVVDCCNGTSSLILKRLNERFGFRSS